MQLRLYRDDPSSERFFANFQTDDVLARLRSLDSRARRKGLGALDPSRNRLIALGMEVNDAGHVTKYGYGVFNLSWQADQHPQWAAQVHAELDEIRASIHTAHGVPLKFVIWAGMGGSAEDKATYQAAGLLRRGPRLYILDSTDPAKLNAILADITKRSKLSLKESLKRTLVVGMAMGMTSREPVLNLQALARLYEQCGVDATPNFIYMTLPESLLEQFAGPRGFRRVDLQMDGANTTAGRHSSPLTRGSLYPLGFASVDLEAWMAGTVLSNEQVAAAWRLASFLEAHGREGRDKVTLALPPEWCAAALWTKQDFEESLGKSETLGIKIVIGEKLRMANYRSPRDAVQDRVFLLVQIKGSKNLEAKKIDLIRHAGYPVAVLTFPSGATLSRYMQVIHYTVFGLAYLREMNFVAQPSVELYKGIANKLDKAAVGAGGIEKTEEWKAFENSTSQAQWRGGVTLRWDRMNGLDEDPASTCAPTIYAGFLKKAFAARTSQYAELTFFGDTRYAASGRAVRALLERAAEKVFRNRLHVAVDIYEGPAMNHSYHEMIIGHGCCFSTVLLSETGEGNPAAGHTGDYHRAQFLATQMALRERQRPVVSITLKSLDRQCLDALEEFFGQTARHLKE